MYKLVRMKKQKKGFFVHYKILKKKDMYFYLMISLFLQKKKNQKMLMKIFFLK